MSADDGLPNEIRLELGALPDVRIFRNNVGVLQDRNGSYVSYGLCVGSADLIGLRSRIITAEMVGMRMAQFAAIECKRIGGFHQKNQRDFIKMVETHGGLSGFATSVEEARKILLL